MRPPKPRSGTPWTEADYAAHGYGRITLRLPLDALDMLQDIADDMGESRAVAVDTLIRMEHEHNARKRSAVRSARDQRDQDQRGDE